MARIRDAITDFTAGEFSPLLAARSDVTLYRHGSASLLNYSPLVQGGARIRNGLPYLATLPFFPCRLIAFVFNKSQKYIFSFSNGRVDIFNPDGSLATSLTGAPWTTAMLSTLSYTQYGDTMFIVNQDMAIQQIMRTGASSFTLAAFAFESAASGTPIYQPYMKYAAAAMTLTPSTLTNGAAVNLTLSGAGAWVAGHIGTIVRYKKKEIIILGVTSAVLANGTNRETLPATAADIDWEEQTFSSVRGYPACVELFADRLIFGGAKSKPSGFWASKTGAYFNFDLGTQLDNEAIWESVIGARVSQVKQFSGVRHLLVFTDQSVYYVPDSDTIVSPKTIEFREQAPYGCGTARPQPFDGAVLFVQDTGSVVREALFDYLNQAYGAAAISLLGAHLISSPSEMAVLYGTTTQPEQYALLVNGDGKISAYHAVRQEKIAAWVPWATQGNFKSICQAGDEVFVAVERTLGAGTAWTLEKFDPTVAPLDCTKKVTIGVAGKVFPGFTHLANMSVYAMSNGHYIGQFTVDGAGTITLDALSPDLTVLEAGFWTAPVIRPMPIDFDVQEGKARGLMKRLIRGILIVDQSVSARIQGTTVLLDFVGDDFAGVAPTKTGQLEFRLLGHSREAQFDIVLPVPGALTVLGLTREVDTHG